jgi:hypothetical protein
MGGLPQRQSRVSHNVAHICLRLRVGKDRRDARGTPHQICSAIGRCSWSDQGSFALLVRVGTAPLAYSFMVHSFAAIAHTTRSARSTIGGASLSRSP